MIKSNIFKNILNSRSYGSMYTEKHNLDFNHEAFHLTPELQNCNFEKIRWFIIMFLKILDKLVDECRIICINAQQIK